ncbi:ABC transporter ATP-binding protein [Marmoricola sp. RAF53]|uniref:ABC transporter ATP-binding protein n=1 Tax=Marmoricola sp. RAF53 TaxID=3233059 RepID=UPI003F98377B
MSSVSFRNAECRYPGADRPAVSGLDLEIADGEFLVLVGPSGCGKSTSLRMLAGLEQVTSGQILIGDVDVTTTPPKDRDIALVFQSYALYPHMTVAENIAFSLRIGGVDKAEQRRRVGETARLLGIDDLLGRKPKELSGGQRQRVAMGRALVREPAVFCMDEPLSNLDAKLRVSTRTQIAALQHRLGITTVYVTHDQVEAMTLGDRVAVMKDGVLQQVDTPLALYDEPANLFVAGFIGSPAMNLLDAGLADGQAEIGTFQVPLERSALTRATGPVTLGIRPEAFRLNGADGGIPVRIHLVEELGSDAFLYGATYGDAQPRDVVIRVGARSGHRSGEVVHVTADPGAVHVFDTASGQRL